MKKFVLFSMTRTGSTMFQTNISSHPKVQCHPAYFGRFFPVRTPDSLAAKLPQWASRERRCANIEAFLADVYAVSGSYDCVGFKHHLVTDDGVIRYVLENDDFTRFHIIRLNHLATYSSGKITVKNRELRERGSDKQKTKIRFDKIDFERHIVQRERRYSLWRPVFDAAGVIEIPYSEARTPAGVEKVWRALGIDAAYIPEERTPKRNSDDMLERFSNPGDVERWIAAHGEADWLHEG